MRSTRPPRPAILRLRDGEAVVELLDGETGVAPGQACVFFDDDGDGARVLGGGWIERTVPGHATGSPEKTTQATATA